MSLSPLMSENEVLCYLGVSKAGLQRIMIERGLKRHEGTKVFSRKQVEAIAGQIEQEIINEDAGTLGRRESTMDSKPRFRQKARLV